MKILTALLFSLSLIPALAQPDAETHMMAATAAYDVGKLDSALAEVDRAIAFDPALAKAFKLRGCLLYTSPSPRDRTRSRMPSSA